MLIYHHSLWLIEYNGFALHYTFLHQLNDPCINSILVQ